MATMINCNKDSKLSFAGIYYSLKNKEYNYYITSKMDKINGEVDVDKECHWNRSVLNDIEQIQRVCNHTCKIIAARNGCYRIISKGDKTYIKEDMYEEAKNSWATSDDRDVTLFADHVHVNFYLDNYSLNNDSILWKFVEHPDYKVCAEMSEFVFSSYFPIPPKRGIEDKIKMDMMIHETITNNSKDPLHQEVAEALKKTQTFKLTYSESMEKAAKYFHKFNAQATVAIKIPDILLPRESPHRFVSERLDKQVFFKLDEDYSKLDECKSVITNDVIYSVKKSFAIPPAESVLMKYYVNWVHEHAMPFTVKVKVTGTACRFDDSPILDKHRIMIFLEKYGFVEKSIEETETSITFEVKGRLVASFGLGTNFSITKLQ